MKHLGVVDRPPLGQGRSILKNSSVGSRRAALVAGIAALMLATLVQPASADFWSPFQAPDIEVDEGEVAVFGFSLSVPFNIDVRYAYATRDGTAKAGKHYRAGTGHVVFPAGARKAAVRIRTHEDAGEEDRDFELLLFNLQTRDRFYSPAWGTVLRIKRLPQRKTVRARIRDTTIAYTREKYGSGYTGPIFGE